MDIPPQLRYSNSFLRTFASATRHILRGRQCPYTQRWTYYHRFLTGEGEELRYLLGAEGSTLHSEIADVGNSPRGHSVTPGRDLEDFTRKGFEISLRY